MLTARDAARVSETDSAFSREGGTASFPERHQRWRRLVGKWFTARRMNALRPRIEAMADHLIDEMVAQGPPLDLVAHFGFPLPVWVICAILGVPDADREKFAYWSGTVLSLTRYSQAEI